MNWGGFAALSLDPNLRGMGAYCPNQGLSGSKPWKGSGMTKSEWKAKKKEFKEKYEGGTKQAIKSDIESLREKKRGTESKEERLKIKAQIRAMESAKRSLRRSGGFIKKSPTSGLPLPDEDETPTPIETPTPTEPPDETPPPDQMQDVINGGGDNNYTTMPVTPGGGSGGTVNVTLPGENGVISEPTGRTIWDVATDLTEGNTMLLLAGAGIVAYFLFFRK